jgi:hypothetical protein
VRESVEETVRKDMIPAPNVIAGVLVGVLSDNWLTVLVSAALWPFAFCLYVSIAHRTRRDSTVASFAARGRHLVLGSPVLTFYAVEFATALATTVPIALLAHAVKRLVS